MARIRRSRIVAVLLVGAGVALSPVVPTHASFGAAGVQIIKNGTAEKGAGSTDGSVVPVPGWTPVSGASGYTVVQYGAAGGFPDSMSPGPVRRGKNFFAGGPSGVATIAEQSAKLAKYKAAIKSGHVTYTLSASLGGFASQSDQAEVDIFFFDKDGFSIGNDSVGPVTPGDRNSVTALDAREVSGVVPKKAVKVLTQMTFSPLSGGYNDGYADNVSLLFFGL